MLRSAWPQGGAVMCRSTVAVLLGWIAAFITRPTSADELTRRTHSRGKIADQLTHEQLPPARSLYRLCGFGACAEPIRSSVRRAYRVLVSISFELQLLVPAMSQKRRDERLLQTSA